MANPYDVAPPNVLQALMMGTQGYQLGSGIAKDQRLSSARQSAQETLQSGGDARNALAQLLGAGDTQGANVLAQYQNNINSVYGTPIYGTGPDGKTQVGTFDKGGAFRKIDTGDFVPTPGIRTVDTGTGTAIIDSRTGQPIGPPSSIPQQRLGQPGMAPQVGAPTGRPQQSGFIPKDVRGASYQGKEGSEQAQIDVALPEKRAKAEGALKGLNRKYGLVTGTIDAAIKSIDEGIIPRAGVGSVLSGVPQTPQFGLAQKLKTIQANIGFDELQSMRENSPTGGALGAISDKENELLSLVRGSVVQGLDPMELKDNLRRIKQLYGEVLQERQEAYQRDYSGVPTRAKGSAYSQPQQQTQGNRKTIGNRSFFQDANGNWFEE